MNAPIRDFIAWVAYRMARAVYNLIACIANISPNVTHAVTSMMFDYEKLGVRFVTYRKLGERKIYIGDFFMKLDSIENLVKTYHEKQEKDR